MDVGIRLADGAGAGGPSIDVQQQDAAVVGVDPVHNKISAGRRANRDDRDARFDLPVVAGRARGRHGRGVRPGEWQGLGAACPAGQFDHHAERRRGRRPCRWQRARIDCASGWAAVSENGTIYVAAVTQSGAVCEGRAVRFGFASQSDRSIPGSFERLELTTVGSRRHFSIRPRERSSSKAAPRGVGRVGRRCCRAGPASDAVLVATPTTLWSVDLVSGASRFCTRSPVQALPPDRFRSGVSRTGHGRRAVTSASISPTLTR